MTKGVVTKGARLGRDLAIWILVAVVLYTLALLIRSEVSLVLTGLFIAFGTPVALIGALLRYNKTAKAEKAEKVARESTEPRSFGLVAAPPIALATLTVALLPAAGGPGFEPGSELPR